MKLSKKAVRCIKYAQLKVSFLPGYYCILHYCNQILQTSKFEKKALKLSLNLIQTKPENLSKIKTWS